MSQVLEIPPEWSPVEQWVWDEILGNRVADFDMRYGEKFDPNNPSGCDADGNDRRISKTFLETILTVNNFRAVIPCKGVRIIGACFNGEIDLELVRVDWSLWLENCRFNEKLKLKFLHVDGGLSFEGSWFGAIADLNGVKIGDYLDISKCTFCDQLNMISAKIGGELCMIGSSFAKSVDMNRVRVGQDLFMRDNATFEKEVSMGSAHIEGVLDMSKSVFNGQVDVMAIEVGGHLIMSGGSFFEEYVNLELAKIGDSLDMRGGTKFNGQLGMRAIEVGGQLHMSDGSYFMEKVSLEIAKIGGTVYMSGGATFNESLELSGAKIGSQLAMIDSVYLGSITMNGAEVAHSIVLGGQTPFKEVDMTAAKIGHELNICGSTFEDSLLMSGIRIGQGFRMSRKATLKGDNAELSTFKGDVELTGAKIGDSLEMGGGTFEGPFRMHGAEIGGLLIMDGKARFKKEVDIKYTRVGGELRLSGSIFDDRLDMEGIKVGKNLLAQHVMFPAIECVKLSSSEIGSSLHLSGSTIKEMDLTSAIITDELHLGSAVGHQPTKWVNPSRMVLRNTTVGAIQDANSEADSWPKELELDGFAYGRLGGLGAKGTADIGQRSSAWFIEWLGRNTTFSPQPYEYLAGLLRKSGYPSKADAILFASRQKSRSDAWEKREDKPRELARWFGLTFLEYSIGYGLGAHYFRLLWWFAGFTTLGFYVLLGSMEQESWDCFTMITASFDQVLPFVTLNESHEEFLLENKSSVVVLYFYFQKIAGYFLGGFLAAGLAGLTQKS